MGFDMKRFHSPNVETVVGGCGVNAGTTDDPFFATLDVGIPFLAGLFSRIVGLRASAEDPGSSGPPSSEPCSWA